ncbi:MAG: LCP family protein [Lachnospiraceae bacterium]|nr:LCP family protein [Lachnospiraceae bacterium]
MKDFNDDDLEFDDDLPELDLSDLDMLTEESSKKSKKYEIKKFEKNDDSSEDENLGELIKYEAMKALSIEDDTKLPSDILADDESDAEYFDYTESDFDEEEEKPKKFGLLLKFVIAFILAIMACAAFLVFTQPGRDFLYRIAGNWVSDQVNKNIEPDSNYNIPTGDDTRYDIPTIYEKEEVTQPPVIEKNESKYRSEDYVKTYLLFGIEEIGGASNTDAIVLMSINTKDCTIKLTSLLRDTYVEIPNYYGNKINSVYAHGLRTGETTEEKKNNGATLLMNVIEETYDIEISGYACVNFNSFEKIIDRLGGIDIKLGATEARYLCNTNYISNPSYRYVKEGWNHLNGNQVVGYCRVRKVATLGGANNDYGRTVRHRRVLNAVVEQYKSLSLGEMYSALKDCLGYVFTNITEEQFTEMINNIVENKIFTVNEMRLPVDGLFKDSGKKGKFNGKYNVTYAILIDDKKEENIKALHEFVFLDGAEPEAPTSPENPSPSGTVTPTQSTAGN